MTTNVKGKEVNNTSDSSPSNLSSSYLNSISILTSFCSKNGFWRSSLCSFLVVFSFGKKLWVLKDGSWYNFVWPDHELKFIVRTFLTVFYPRQERADLMNKHYGKRWLSQSGCYHSKEFWQNKRIRGSKNPRHPSPCYLMVSILASICLISLYLDTTLLTVNVLWVIFLIYPFFGSQSPSDNAMQDTYCLHG